VRIIDLEQRMESVQQRRVNAILGHVLPSSQHSKLEFTPTAASGRMLEGKVMQRPEPSS